MTVHTEPLVSVERATIIRRYGYDLVGQHPRGKKVVSVSMPVEMVGDRIRQVGVTEWTPLLLHDKGRTFELFLGEAASLAIVREMDGFLKRCFEVFFDEGVAPAVLRICYGDTWGPASGKW